MKRSLHIVLAILFALQPSQGTAQNKSGVTQDAKAASVEVKIDNFSFTPATITVTAGTTVRWTNRDDIPIPSRATPEV